MILKFREEIYKQKINAEGDFTDDEVAKLKDFVEYANVLYNMKFLKKKLEIKGIIETSFEFDEESFFAFLHKLRPFHLNDEPTNYYHIYNIIFSKFKCNNVPYFKHYLSSMRNVYNGKKSQMRISGSFNGEDFILNSEKKLNKWIYDYEYHPRKNKQTFFKQIEKFLSDKMQRYVFCVMLFDKAHAICELAKVISHMTDEKGERIAFFQPAWSNNSQ